MCLVNGEATFDLMSHLMIQKRLQTTFLTSLTLVFSVFKTISNLFHFIGVKCKWTVDLCLQFAMNKIYIGRNEALNVRSVSVNHSTNEVQ